MFGAQSDNSHHQTTWFSNFINSWKFQFEWFNILNIVNSVAIKKLEYIQVSLVASTKSRFLFANIYSSSSRLLWE